MACETYTQKAFAALMRAMSRPGTVQQLDPREGDAPYMPVLLTLLDHEVTFAAIGRGIRSDEIAMATGSKETTVNEADYVLVFGGDSAGAVGRAKKGDLRYPDKGATIIYLVESLDGKDTKIRLTGPGIPVERIFALDGFSADEVADLRAANAEFPLGVDCIFVDGRARTASIPRSSRMEVA